MNRNGGAASSAPAATPVALQHLLDTTSRTFALTIPLLDEPLRCEVTVAYLLFRVADTFEDATLWPRERKMNELDALARFLDDPIPEQAVILSDRWRKDPPMEHRGYLDLLAEFPSVMRAAAALSPEAWRCVSAHTMRTCRAMKLFVARQHNGALRLADLADLKDYCYAVAGIVGEMLTELFLLSQASSPAAAAGMRRDAAAFGEALQLVNILKDSATDATEGRYYLPAGIERSTVFSLARADLETAARYCAGAAQAGFHRGILAFTALPILLARATLDLVQTQGPGAKVSRARVTAIVEALHQALDRNSVSALLQRETS